MCVIFFEVIAFTPVANSIDADFGNAGANRPSNLKWRSFFVVAGACGGAFEYNWSTCIVRNISCLVEAANLFIMGQFSEIKRFAIVYQYVYLRFNTELRVLNGLT